MVTKSGKANGTESFGAAFQYLVATRVVGCFMTRFLVVITLAR